MTADTQRLHDYLSHILLAIQRIQLYTKGNDQAGFQQNVMIPCSGCGGIGLSPPRPVSRGGNS